MRDYKDLAATLRRIDGRGYKAYHDIKGAFRFPRFELHVDHVQGDPFAAPSKLRVRVPMAEAALPASLFSNRVRRIALEDFLARAFRDAILSSEPPRTGSGKSGLILIDAGAQEVLERTAALVTPEFAEARIQLGLPAAGRRVLGRAAETLLIDSLPAIALRALTWEALPQERARLFVECIENQEHIRAQLDERGLVAFVANGARLPRASGASDSPLQSDAVVAFQSPEAFEVSIDVPNPVPADAGAKANTLTGLGIARGVTLIVGGGYHGKSTLLQAVQRSVYPHIPGDGREYVVSTPGLVKIRAEDGRAVRQVDIHAFIGELPGGRSTQAFDSEDASGSTSQAANIAEALEAGATGLLLDEDTCATNFMLRDARMQALISKDNEPITPFLERVREIYDDQGVSTILVMGGCGDYFEVADRVIELRAYRALDATAEAKRIASAHPSGRRSERGAPMSAPTERIPLAESFDASRGRREVKIDAHERGQLVYGREPIDLAAVEQLVDLSQTRAVGLAIYLAVRQFIDGRRSLREVLDQLDAWFDREGLDALDPFHRPDFHPGSYARPRRLEIAAAINRTRTLRVRQRES